MSESPIAIYAVICGADNWNDIEEFGKPKRKFLARFLDLPSGIPSHDAFNRVFARIQSEQSQTCCLSWVLRRWTRGMAASRRGLLPEHG